MKHAHKNKDKDPIVLKKTDLSSSRGSELSYNAMAPTSNEAVSVPPLFQSFTGIPGPIETPSLRAQSTADLDLHPVDRGLHAWLFVFSAFVLEFLIWGFAFRYVSQLLAYEGFIISDAFLICLC